MPRGRPAGRHRQPAVFSSAGCRSCWASSCGALGCDTGGLVGFASPHRSSTVCSPRGSRPARSCCPCQVARGIRLWHPWWTGTRPARGAAFCTDSFRATSPSNPRITRRPSRATSRHSGMATLAPAELVCIKSHTPAKATMHSPCSAPQSAFLVPSVMNSGMEGSASSRSDTRQEGRQVRCAAAKGFRI